MVKIYCNKETNVVEQIFPYEQYSDIWENYKEDTFGTFYLVEVEDLKDIDYSYKYDKDLNDFVENPDYVEHVSTVEPSMVQVLQEQLNALQAQTMPVDAFEELRRENEDLKNELESIKKHLGL